MLGKYIGWTRIYLIVLTVLIGLRFVLEAAGADNGVTSELSVTRLYFVLPVFLGIRFATEKLGGIKEMVLASFTYFVWGTLLVNLAAGLETVLDLGTHYIFTGLVAFPVVLVVGTLILSIICWVATFVNRKLA